MDKIRFYTLPQSAFKVDLTTITDEQFMDNAETFGTVYSKEAFDKAVKENDAIHNDIIVRVVFLETEEPKMSYEHFLFASLLLDYFKDNETLDLAYDVVYSKVFELYKCFEDSDENIDTKSEYECILKYFNNNESFLVHMLRA